MAIDAAGRRRPTLASWLTDTRADVPPEIRAALIRSLHGNIQIYIGGVLNTIVVALLLAWRIGTPLFLGWAVFELVMASIRLPVLLRARREARAGRYGFQDAYILLTLFWSTCVGIGAAAALLSGDLLSAVIACTSAGAMLGGICFRFFAAPRLVLAMQVGMGMPTALASFVSGQWELAVAAMLIPLYIYAMTAAAWHMHRLMVTALKAEREHAYQARHDALTGLLNRSGLAEAVEARGNEPFALFFIDLDRFKQVNDSLGHAAGDRLLAMVANRLAEALGPGETIARLGGDEFVLIAPLTGVDAGLKRGDHLVAAISAMPYVLDDDGVLIGASVGVALRPQHGRTLAELLVAADEALYRAKFSDLHRCLMALDEDCEPDLDLEGEKVAA